MTTNLQYLFELYCLPSWEKQFRLSTLIGDHKWWLDLDAGTITFNDRYVFPVQVIGIESAEERSWLWAWADLDNPIPYQLLRAANQVWEYGEKYGIETLTVRQLDLAGLDGDYLAMIATGISRSSCFYRGAGGGGATYILIGTRLIDKQPGWRAADLVQAMTTLTNRYTFNHKTALMAYCAGRNLPVRVYPEYGLHRLDEDVEITITLPGNEEIVAQFDKTNCLEKLDVIAGS